MTSPTHLYKFPVQAISPALSRFYCGVKPTFPSFEEFTFSNVSTVSNMRCGPGPFQEFTFSNVSTVLNVRCGPGSFQEFTFSNVSSVSNMRCGPGPAPSACQPSTDPLFGWK